MIFDSDSIKDYLASCGALAYCWLIQLQEVITVWGSVILNILAFVVLLQRFWIQRMTLREFWDKRAKKKREEKKKRRIAFFQR